MEIQITDYYRLKTDEKQWKIQKRGMIKGEEKWTSVGYYSNLHNAVRGLVQLDLRHSDVKGLSEAVLRVENMAEALSRVLDVDVVRKQ